MKKKILYRVLALLMVVCLTAAFAGCGALNAYVEIAGALDEMAGTGDPSSSAVLPGEEDDSDPEKPDAGSKPENIPTESTPAENVPAESTPQDTEPSESEDEAVTAEESLAELRMLMQGSDYVAAIAFIGYVEGPMGDGYGEFFYQQGYTYWYPFINEIPYDRLVETDGYEMYCLVPRDEDASVAVNQWLMREYGGQVGGSTGDVLYRSESGEPILLLCNLNANVPNMDVTVVGADGEEVNFNPSITMYSDGWVGVNTPDNVLDFTIPMVWDTGAELSPDELQGSWTCWDALTPAGDPLVCSLTFYENEYGGDAVTYSYGLPESEIFEQFTGMWYPSDQDPSVTMFEMELTGGTALEETEPYWFRGAYRITASQDSADAIIVTHLEGTPLVYGCEGGSFTFYRGNG